MFDISFTELLVVAVIALFVIGPERLPQTVKEVSLWIGRLKRSLRETRRELEQQIGADEIRRTLHNENVLHSLQHIKRDVEDTLNKDISLDGEYAEEENYDLPPHDPNNDIDDEVDSDSESKAKNTKPEPATVTAEALMSGDIPFASAAEIATANNEKSKQSAESAAKSDSDSAATDAKKNHQSDSDSSAAEKSDPSV